MVIRQRDTEEKYLSLIREYPKSFDVIYLYADFVADVLGDVEKAEVARQIALQIQTDTVTGGPEGGRDSKLSIGSDKKDPECSTTHVSSSNVLSSALNRTALSNSGRESSRIGVFHHTVALRVCNGIIIIHGSEGGVNE